MPVPTAENILGYSFEGNDVRVIVRDGEPWFVAKDVADALGYHPKKITQTLQAFCKAVTETVTPTAGGMQTVKIIPEPDLYRLIMRSKKPQAEATVNETATVTFYDGERTISK